MKRIQIAIRLIFFLFGIVGCTGFVVPFLKRRILNVGNLAGLVVCIILVLYAIFMPGFHAWVRLFWRRAIGKVVLSIFGVGLVAGAILIIVMTTLMVKAAYTSPAENATVIVLGCKAYGERPSLTLMERLDAAIKYLNENPESACIVSGGQGADETMSEAQCMYLYMTDSGIAPERIYKEDQSTTTRENLVFSYEIIKDQDLNQNIAIATNNYHEYRAGMIADDIGLEYGAVSGKTALWLLPTYYAREILAILYEWVF